MWSSNGNEYDGEWRGGAIWGKGILIWGNGNRFEGYWENGVPKGKGTFTWSNNGACLVEDENLYHHKSGFDAARKRSSVDGMKPVSFPRICIWELDGEAGDITCDIVDNVEASMFYKDGRESYSEPTKLQSKSPCSSTDCDVKKPGQTISKGHKNYDLMLNLQLGIRYSFIFSLVNYYLMLRPCLVGGKSGKELWMIFKTYTCLVRGIRGGNG